MQCRTELERELKDSLLHTEEIEALLSVVASGLKLAYQEL
jgi:hypothetical protein